MHTKAWQSNQFNESESKGYAQKKQAKGVRNWFHWHSERTTWAVPLCPIEELLTSRKYWENDERKEVENADWYKVHHVNSLFIRSWYERIEQTHSRTD